MGKRMCDDHFKKREEDDSLVTDLEKRINDRQSTREAQKQDRIEKEAAKVQAEKDAKEAKEAAKKADILSAMSQGYDKEAARKRRGEKRRLKRRSNAIRLLMHKLAITSFSIIILLVSLLMSHIL